jgi:hypothetical protein
MLIAPARLFACSVLTLWGMVCLAGATPAAQQVLDRALARVGATPIMLTDLTAARALGVVEAPEGAAGDLEALNRMIDRQLALGEMAKFPGPEPHATLVDEEVARMTALVGGRLPAILEAAGLDERRLRELARNTLRIQAYLQEKFPPGPVSDGDARQYYAAHPEEFTRNGVLMPYQEAQPAARAAVVQSVRQSRVTRWFETLRSRVDVVILGK